MPGYRMRTSDMRTMPPTKQHRPAIFPGILGTVYAVNDDLQVKYFDYDFDAAYAYAGVTPDRDVRRARKPRNRNVTYTGHPCEPKAGSSLWILWVLKA